MLKDCGNFYPAESGYPKTSGHAGVNYSVFTAQRIVKGKALQKVDFFKIKPTPGVTVLDAIVAYDHEPFSPKSMFFACALYGLSGH